MSSAEKEWKHKAAVMTSLENIYGQMRTRELEFKKDATKVTGKIKQIMTQLMANNKEAFKDWDFEDDLNLENATCFAGERNELAQEIKNLHRYLDDSYDGGNPDTRKVAFRHVTDAFIDESIASNRRFHDRELNMMEGLILYIGGETLTSKEKVDKMRGLLHHGEEEEKTPKKWAK